MSRIFMNNYNLSSLALAWDMLPYDSFIHKIKQIVIKM